MRGRSFYYSEGHNQLLKVIGRVGGQATDPGGAIDQRSVSSVVGILRRLRECSQYVRAVPKDERDVQDLVWIMLRSHFDRLEREETLPRFGVKQYRPDFGIPELRLLVEVKFIGQSTSPGSIQDELLADVAAYLGEHSMYSSLVALVYDAAHKLRDPRAFIDACKSVEGIVDVIVVLGIGA